MYKTEFDLKSNAAGLLVRYLILSVRDNAHLASGYRVLQFKNSVSQALSNNLARFYSRDAMLARSLRQRRVRRPSVCLSHAGIVPAERKQDREMYTI